MIKWLRHTYFMLCLVWARLCLYTFLLLFVFVYFESLQHETFRFVLTLTGLTVLHYFGIVYIQWMQSSIYLFSFDSIHKQKPNKTENNLKINLKF